MLAASVAPLRRVLPIKLAMGERKQRPNLAHVHRTGRFRQSMRRPVGWKIGRLTTKIVALKVARAVLSSRYPTVLRLHSPHNRIRIPL